MILIISTCSEKLSENEFVKPIVNLINEEVIIKHYSEIKGDDLKNSDKIIICGTALKDNVYLRDMTYFEWIKNFNKPLLGICSGMQIIGLNFEAKLISSKEIGMKNIKVLIENKLFSEDFQAYELHNNSLDKLNEFEILAKTNNSVQIIKHKEKETYGILFHPEVRNKEIIKNFLKI
jgi:GMP synthase (glutamine-hydrolysing)